MRKTVAVEEISFQFLKIFSYDEFLSILKFFFEVAVWGGVRKLLNLWGSDLSPSS